jgi:hypothetical protein
MLSQLQAIVEKLSLASLQLSKDTKSKEPALQQSVKSKTKSKNASRCRNEKHVAYNNPLDADTKSSSSESDKGVLKATRNCRLQNFEKDRKGLKRTVNSH